jgi:CRISPR/Cas system-associated exonuclease Cas4 (RecB family)
MSTSYLVWLQQEMALEASTPLTYGSVIHEIIKMLIEDAKDRAMERETYE